MPHAYGFYILLVAMNEGTGNNSKSLLAPSGESVESDRACSMSTVDSGTGQRRDDSAAGRDAETDPDGKLEPTTDP